MTAHRWNPLTLRCDCGTPIATQADHDQHTHHRHPRTTQGDTMSIEINPAYGETRAVEAALLGRRITTITRRKGDHDSYGYSGYGDIATLTLDNGAVVDLYGHDGGCACTAGCYELADLAALADVDNIITAVKFDASDVTDDGYGEPCGAYRVFVFAEDKRVQLASFEGDDGNGYYGTGYYVRVRPITQPEGADQ